MRLQNPTHALLWEQFARTQLMVIAAFVAGAASVGGAWWFVRDVQTLTEYDYHAVITICTFAMNVSFWFLLGHLLLGSGDDQDLQFAVPGTQLRLPVATPKLVLVRLLYGAGVAGILGLFDVILMEAVFGENLREWPMYRAFPLAWPVIYLFCQAAACALGPISLGSTLAGILIAFTAMNGIFYNFKFHIYDRESYTPTMIASVALGSIVVSIAGVTLHRRGAYAFLNEFPARISLRRLGRPANALRFNSPLHALRWFEWRRQAGRLPFVFVFLLLTIFPYLYSTNTFLALPGDDYPPEVIAAVVGDLAMFSAYLALVIATFFATGMFFFQNYRMLTGSLGVFHFIRPASTRLLAQARLSAVFRAVRIVTAFLIALALVTFYLALQTEERTAFRPFINQYWGWTGLGLAALSVAGVAALVWIMLWLGNGLGYWMIASLCLLLFRYTPFFSHLPEHLRDTYAYWTAAALATAILAWMLWTVYQRRLANRRILFALVLIAPLAALGFHTAINWGTLSDGTTFNLFAVGYAGVTVALLTVAPLATVPLTLHWARHR